MKKKTVTKKKIKHNEDFFSHAKKVVGKKRYDEAILKGNKKADEIRLKMAREIIGKNQTEFKGLTQPEVSKIEARKDMKISTLVKYAKGLGMRVQISLIYEDDEKNEGIAIMGKS
jgi:hypothetical protein